MQQRIEWIDMTKGLVMILTVYMHSWLNGVPILGDWVNAFFMPLFFFISGVLLNPDKYSVLTFLKRRWFTLYRPYIIFSTILILLCAIVMGGNTFFCNTLLSGWGGYALWFIPVLALAELGYFLIRKITGSKAIIVLFLVGCACLGFVSYIFKWHNPYNWYLAFTAIGFYGIGNLLKQKLIKIDGSALLLAVCVSFIISLTCFLNPERPQWFINNLATPWSYPAALGGTLFVCLFCKFSEGYVPKIVISTLCYVGRNTFVILAFHQVTMQLLTKTGLLPNGLSVRISMWIIMIILIEIINRFAPQILGHSKP